MLFGMLSSPSQLTANLCKRIAGQPWPPETSAHVRMLSNDIFKMYDSSVEASDLDQVLRAVFDKIIVLSATNR